MSSLIRIDNILSNEERKLMIKESKPLFLTGEQLNEYYGPKAYPSGDQTHPHLHEYPAFITPIRNMLLRIQTETGMTFMTNKAWVNRNIGKRKEECWHNHEKAPYVCVYYMKTIPFINSGTRFRKKFVRSPQNSLIIFPGQIEHTVPTYPHLFNWTRRYSFSMNLFMVE